MSSQRELDQLSIEELEHLLYVKRRAERRARVQRLQAEGRLVEVKGLTPPDLLQSGAANGQDTNGQQRPLLDLDDENDVEEMLQARRRRQRFNRLLLLVEIGAVLGLIVLAVMVWSANQELNQEISAVQEAQSVSQAPTAQATPVIGVVVLPSGHKPPVNGRPPEPGEAGDIPEHLLPILDAYQPPPIPTPGPEQARRIQIPALSIDKPIVQGDDWEQLKKGVGQHIGSAQPGRKGNLVLSAHNDIYGEIFRYLDRLKPGDQVIVSTERQSYTYVIREIEIVEPTDVWVMEPTEHASATLISCYPYLVNNKRIVVFADLAAKGPLSGTTG
ncbi:MAG: class D sortase [Candidatus Promineifilaceae bacterium]|nr:class D sortase [Candidatus Promineifilaceae bacterium]